MLMVFIDGKCSLCTQLARFIKKRDSKKHIEIHSLESNYAEKIFSKDFKYVQALESIVVLEGEDRFFFDQAIFRIIDNLPFFWRVLKIFELIPEKFTFFLYLFIAKNRRIFRSTKDSNYCVSNN